MKNGKSAVVGAKKPSVSAVADKAKLEDRLDRLINEKPGIAIGTRGLRILVDACSIKGLTPVKLAHAYCDAYTQRAGANQKGGIRYGIDTTAIAQVAVDYAVKYK